MEHQTPPSGFPGNFRKRKVLGTLWFPSGLPETLGKAKSRLVPDFDISGKTAESKMAFNFAHLLSAACGGAARR